VQIVHHIMSSYIGCVVLSLNFSSKFFITLRYIKNAKHSSHFTLICRKRAENRMAVLWLFWLFCTGEFFNAPLGNIFAEDEDDWDVDNKTFAFVDSDLDTKYFKYDVYFQFF